MEGASSPAADPAVSAESSAITDDALSADAAAAFTANGIHPPSVSDAATTDTTSVGDEKGGESAGEVVEETREVPHTETADVIVAEEASIPPAAHSQAPPPKKRVTFDASVKGEKDEVMASASANGVIEQAEHAEESTAKDIKDMDSVPADSAMTTTTTAKTEDVATNFLNETFASFSQGSTVLAQENSKGTQGHTDTLHQRIENDRRDGEAWLGLIDDAMQKADLDALRKVYEDFFIVYPNAARQYQEYASVELSHSEFANVEAIFTRCLRNTPSTDLWRFYLQYTRRVNPLPPPGGKPAASGEDSERERVRKVIEGAYEFALRFIGHSRDAGDVWREYITLLKERETFNQWQAGQKMDDVRRAYQRAVSVPLANVEQLWREYDAYENGLNRITAKKFLADRSAAYMTARSVFREMRTLTDNLHRPIVPRVPCWAMPPSLDPVVSPLTVVRDRHHVESWKKYLRWEEDNPLQLDDPQTVHARVLMAYRKAVMHMRFYPEIWYMASDFLQRNEREDEAMTWLKNGLEACTGSSLLAFAFVEQAERHGQTQECGSVFNGLLEWYHAELERMHQNVEDKIRAIDEEAERLKADAAARKRDEGASDAIEGEEREMIRRAEEQREQRRTAERERVRPKVDELKEYASLVWIKYMHFVRRTEGQRPSRSIFARARKSKFCTWQVFEANALMEYHCSKDVAVATKVFELALKTYGADEAFVVRYLEFLLSINDDNNARALFERTVGNFTPDRARPIWDRWCEYEYSFGDTASIARIEARLAQLYPLERATKRLMDRNSYMDLDVVGPRDLGLRSTGVPGSASAAERAVTASKEMAWEAGGGGILPPTGPRADAVGLQAVVEEGPIAAAAGGPHAKRARYGRDGVSPTPPPASLRPIPTGPRGTKRSVSPPSRFVPPPRAEPAATSTPPPAGQQQQQHQQNKQQHAATPPPAYLEIPEAILYFMDALPNSSSFDGPRFSADDIVECLLRTSLPAPGGPGRSGGGSGFGSDKQTGPRTRRGMRSGRRR